MVGILTGVFAKNLIELHKIIKMIDGITITKKVWVINLLVMVLLFLV